jgi:hypothetical protein
MLTAASPRTRLHSACSFLVLAAAPACDATGCRAKRVRDRTNKGPEGCGGQGGSKTGGWRACCDHQAASSHAAV